MLHFDSSHSIVTRGSRAPPHLTLPAFLNLNGTFYFFYLFLNLLESCAGQTRQGQ